MKATREDCVAEALSWLGTPYHHHGRIKHVGVDCGQLLQGVYGNIGVAAPRALQYAHDWHLHRSEEMFVGIVESFGTREVYDATPLPGDIIVYKFGRCFSHGAIYVGDGRIVHSYIGLGVTLSGIADGMLADRPVRCFALDWEGMR